MFFVRAADGVAFHYMKSNAMLVTNISSPSLGNFANPAHGFACSQNIVASVSTQHNVHRTFLHARNNKNRPEGGLYYLRGLVNEVGTAIRNHNGYIYIPNLKIQSKV